MKFYSSINSIARLVILFCFSLFLITTINSVPMYNQYDPFAYHKISGMNKSYKKISGKTQFALNVSPFYQNAAYARDNTNSRVPEGEIFGWWNLFGLFYGEDSNQIKAAPASKAFVLDGGVPNIPNAATIGYYPKLSAAWRVLDNKDGDTVLVPDDYNTTAFDENLTDPQSFKDVSYLKNYIPKAYVNYEKMGIRLEMNLDFNCGIGINVKSGLVDYKQTPTYYARTTAAPVNNSLALKYLTDPDVMKDVLAEVGLDISKREETTLEDTYVQLHYQMPFDLMNQDDEHVVTLVPFISTGLWIPTGKEAKQNAFFSIPTGNDGFWGLTVDGAINISIPDAMQFGVGAGVVKYFERSLKNYRIANHEYQQTIFPWTADVKKDPGLLWYFNASMKAPEFIDNFSAYADFIYLNHNVDDIKMNESDEARNAYFKPEINEELSRWWATMFQGGIEYSFNEGLQIGLGFQTHLSGRRVYRNTTIMGTFSFVF